MYLELSSKRIDPKTGSEYKEKKVFRLDADGNPTNSIVFHQTADLLGIKAFDRINPHVYRKLASIYNWAVGETGTNDPDTVVSAINSYRSKLGVTYLGKELLDHIYRNVRLEEDRQTYEEKQSQKQEQIKRLNENFKKEGKRASEIKKEALTHKKAVEEDSVKSEKRVQETVEAWQRALPKDNSIKVKVVKETSVREEIPLDQDWA